MEHEAAPPVVEQWLRSVGLSDPALFDRRLAWDGLDVDGAEAEFARCPPLNTDPSRLLRELLAGSSPVGSTDDDQAAVHSTVCFVELWQRLAEGAWVRLITVLGDELCTAYELTAPSARAGALGSGLVAELVVRLAEVGEGVLWREFMAQRTLDQALFAHLGDGPGSSGPRRHRYLAFLEGLRVDAMAGLLSSYPVLGQHLVTVIGQWTRQVRLLLVRCHEDLNDLVRVFGLPPGGQLAEIRLGLSDPHRGGQSVAILEFAADSEGGSRHRVVYKPKDLAIDQKFQELLPQLSNPRPDDPPLAGVSVLPRGRYGWMAYVPHQPSRSDQELAAFFRYAGRLTAVLHVLGATDCHHENLIASGEQLHLVDAETLLGGGPQLRDDDLTTRIAHSVTTIGILPQWHVFGRRRLARDVSALGMAPPPAPIVSVRGWQYRNTDAMLVGPEPRALPVPTSSPVATGEPNRVADFLDELATGFAEQLATIAADRHAWLAPGGHLDRFTGLPHRVVLRPTWIYLWLRQQQLEPAALRSAFEQRLVLEKLTRSYVGGVGRPEDWPLFGLELAQMANLDVPFLELDVGSVDLLLSDGSRRRGYFEVSGLDAARAKLVALDADATAFQLQLLRGAVVSKQPLSARVEPGLRLVHENAPHARGEAGLIADHLVETAIDHSRTQSEWLGSEVLEDLETYRFGPLGLSLYSGRVGVALFLAAASQQAFARSDDHAAVARRALAEVPDQLGDPSPETVTWFWRGQPLGIAGAGGILLGVMLAEELLPGLAPMGGWSRLLAGCDDFVLGEDRRHDLVFGLGGLIGPLLRLGTTEALDLADRAGRVLIEHQEPSGGWRVDAAGVAPPLTGFSHGASGLAAVLAALGEVTGDGAYGAAARRALHWERSTMDAERGIWPDLRVRADDAHGNALSWCHGAPGIALARLCVRGTAVADTRSEEDLRIALALTSDPDANPFLDSLCCGRLGRSAILRAAGRRAATDGQASARELEARVLGDCAKRGAYASVRSPGLFQGLAGVGLAMLDSLDDSRPVLEDVLSTGLLSHGRAARQR